MPPPEHPAIGPTVRRLAADRGLSMTDLAEATGLHRVALHAILAGRRNPRMDSLRRIAQAIGCTPADLLKENSEEQEKSP